MTTLKSQRVRFSDYVADLGSGEVFKDGTKIRLQEKPSQVLAMLLQRPKELVSRQELINKVWAKTYVEGDLCLNVAIRRLRAALKDSAQNATFIETVGSHGYRFIADVTRTNNSHSTTESARKHPRLAVFPLEAAAHSHCDSFAAAMTELVIVELRRLHPSLSVVAPEFTTERLRKGKSKVAICREFSADYMLVGEVGAHEDQTRIIARLLKVRSQSCVWAESYMQSRSDLFSFQVEISRKIAVSLAQAIPNSVHTAQPESVPPSTYETYLQGCSLRARLSEESLSQCIPLFEEAVRECPNFCQAWIALANAHCMIARLGIAPSPKTFSLVKNYVDKALSIEDHPEARTALAYYQFFYEYDWEAAETTLLQALAKDAKYPLAVGGYAQLLAALGRNEEAIFLMRQASELDPLASHTAIMFGWTLYYARKYKESLEQLNKATQVDSSAWIGHSSAGMALERLGRLQEAVAEFRLAVEYSDNSSLARAHLAYGLARMGKKDEAKEILVELIKLRHSSYFSPYWIAVIYAGLNDVSNALAWLEIAATERSGWIVFARVDPKFDVLHADPLFHRIVSGIGPSRRSVIPA